MQKRQVRGLTILAVCVLVLVMINTVLVLANRSIRQGINNKQAYINQSVGLNKLNNNIIQSLAELAAKKKDPQIKQLLNDHGITFTINTPASGTAGKGAK